MLKSEFVQPVTPGAGEKEEFYLKPIDMSFEYLNVNQIFKLSFEVIFTLD